MDVAGGASCVGANTNMRPPWLDQYAGTILGVQHDLPNNLEEFLPKFDLDKKKRILIFF